MLYINYAIPIFVLFLYTCDSEMNGVKMSIQTNVYYSTTASTLKSRQKQLESVYGVLDFKSTAFSLSNGKLEDVANSIGIELGINNTPADKNISFFSYVTSSKNADDMMFQGKDGYLYNLDFTSGQVSSIAEDAWIEENYQGLINPNDESDRNYDLIDFGQDSADIINYTFAGAGDGCNKISTNAQNFASSSSVSKWGDSIQWVYQEVDLKNPSVNFLNSVYENTSKYINKNDANYIIQTMGYDAYIDELVTKAAGAMSYNDSSATTIAEYFEQVAAEEAQKAEEAAKKQKAEEEAKLQAELEAAQQEADAAQDVDVKA